MIAQAAQEYGLIVRDQTHHAIGLYAENPIPLGKNPYYSHGVPAPPALSKGNGRTRCSLASRGAASKC